MLSVRRMAYTVKPVMKRTEKTSSQSMVFTGTLGRGPRWSASITFLSVAASNPASLPENTAGFVSDVGIHIVLLVSVS